MAVKGTFVGLFLINFAVTLGFGMADAFFSVYTQSLGAHGLSLGLAIVSYNLAKIIFSPFMGKLADHVGPRKMLGASLYISLIVSTGFLFLDDLGAILVLRVLQGVGLAIFRPVLLFLLADITVRERRSSAVGTFDISFYSALGIGPIIGGLLNDAFGYAGVYCALSACCAFAAIAAQILPLNNSSCFKPTPLRSSQSIRRTLIDDVKNGGILTGLMVFIFGRSISISVLITFLPLLLMVELGQNSTSFGLVMASSTIMMALTLRTMGRLADRIDRSTLIINGGVGVAFLYLIIPLSLALPHFIALGIGIGVFSAMSQPACTSLLIDHGEFYGKGLAAGAFNSAMNIGFVVGPLFGAYLYSEISMEAVFYCSGGIGILTVLLFSLLNARRSLAMNPINTHEMRSGVIAIAGEAESHSRK